jgi:hypothetical protein
MDLSVGNDETTNCSLGIESIKERLHGLPAKQTWSIATTENDVVITDASKKKVAIIQTAAA